MTVEKLVEREVTCSIATQFTRNPTWPDLGLKLSCSSGKAVTDCLSHGKALRHCPAKTDAQKCKRLPSSSWVLVPNLLVAQVLKKVPSNEEPEASHKTCSVFSVMWWIDHFTSIHHTHPTFILILSSYIHIPVQNIPFPSRLMAKILCIIPIAQYEQTA
jgi:hypothetical protein